MPATGRITSFTAPEYAKAGSPIRISVSLINDGNEMALFRTVIQSMVYPIRSRIITGLIPAGGTKTFNVDWTMSVIDYELRATFGRVEGTETIVDDIKDIVVILGEPPPPPPPPALNLLPLAVIGIVVMGAFLFLTRK